MTQEEILQYNKRCVEFLNLHRDEEVVIYNMHSYCYDLLKFDSDWNWIMEVVRAIAMYYTDKEVPQVHLLNQPIFTPKEAVVQAINQFLIWFKQNKK
jgi:hypothetical protein